MIVTELDIERLIHLSINEDDSYRDRYREKLVYLSTNRDDSHRYRYREVDPSINQ